MRENGDERQQCRSIDIAVRLVCIVRRRSRQFVIDVDDIVGMGQRTYVDSDGL